MALKIKGGILNIQPWSWPNILIFATIISVILSITLIAPPSPPASSIKSAPLNKARILKYSRKCDESLSSTL